MASKIYAPLDRRPREHAKPGPVTVRYECPDCGGPHPKRDCVAAGGANGLLTNQAGHTSTRQHR